MNHLSITMDIQARKIQFVQEFLNLQNEELLTRLENLLHTDKSKRARNISAMTTEEFNERIDKSMEDSMQEKLTGTADLKTEIEKWG